MKIRKTTTEDLQTVMPIYENARVFIPTLPLGQEKTD